MKRRATFRLSVDGDDLRLIRRLRLQLHLRTDLDVLRLGLRLLRAKTERDDLRAAFHAASAIVSSSMRQELAELDPLAGEGIE